MSKDRKGRLYFNNGDTEIRIDPTRHRIPEGFKRGRLNIPGRVPDSGKGSKFYNNGAINKRFYSGDEIPEGWVIGKIGRFSRYFGENNGFFGKHHSKESIDKMLETRKRNRDENSK